MGTGTGHRCAAHRADPLDWQRDLDRDPTCGIVDYRADRKQRGKAETMQLLGTPR